MNPEALDRRTYVPLYHQLKQIFLEEIRSGKLKPDDRLPSEDEVAVAYGVSTITVRRTLTDLASAGYIRRERGRGTFVLRPPIEQGPRELTSFSHEMMERGLRSTSKVLDQKVINADASIAEQLRLEEGAEVFLLRRLRLADGEPMGIQTAHIPLVLAPSLINEDFSSASLYDRLQRKFGLLPAHAREIHSATRINGQDAALLHLQEGSLGLAAMRLTFLADGRPFEFVNSVMRGDRYQIVLDLVANAPVQ
jgi:GntR family transcriptional regulator, N-acetylglucosamine utilization regulator